MLTRQQVLEAVRNNNVGYDRGSCEMIDQRDYQRLLGYFPMSETSTFGFELKDGVTEEDWGEISDFTEEIVLENMKSDLDFAFDKAINQRGISSSLMFEVMQMYMWILEDNLAHYHKYDPYGLPLYKKIAEKYNLPDRSNEYFD